MATKNTYQEKNSDLVREGRNRIISAIRGLIPESMTRDGIEPIMLMGTGPLGNPGEDMCVRLAVEFIRRTGGDAVCVAFDEHKAELRPRSVNVIVMYGGVVHFVQDQDFWIDRNNETMAIVPRVGSGYFLIEGDQLTLRAGKMARTWGPGIARAHKLIKAHAADVTERAAKAYLAPFANLAS